MAAADFNAPTSFINTDRDMTKWSINEHRLKRQGIVNLSDTSPSIWIDGTVNKNFLKPDEVSEIPKWPYRDFEGTIDPTSGFIAPGLEVVRNAGNPGKFSNNKRPPTEILKEEFTKFKNRGLISAGAGRGIDCLTEWNSKKKDQGYLRAEIAGFVSEEEKKRRIPEIDHLSDLDSKILRQTLAHRYNWTSTQRKMYDQVFWDKMLPEKPCVYPISYERTADPVSATFNRNDTQKRLAGTAYQRLGDVWDRAQIRKGYYNNRPHTFSSVMPRAGQLVGYCGEVGTQEDPANKDNPYTDLSRNLLTKRRGDIPGLAYSSASPHIPGYTGMYQIKPPVRPVSSDERISTTADVHRHIPLEAERIDYGKRTPFASQVTTVPPQNPFKRIPEGSKEPMSTNEVERISAEVVTDKKKYGLDATLPS